jgi:hypothetical protein
MRYYISVQKREGNPDVPSDVLYGYTDELPTAGKRFFMTITEGRYPYLHTSEVLALAHIGEDDRLTGMFVKTRNSLYQLKISHTEGS